MIVLKYIQRYNSIDMVKTKIVDSEQLQSKVISFLRFPLIVGVVLIHTQIGTINGIMGDYNRGSREIDLKI